MICLYFNFVLTDTKNVNWERIKYEEGCFNQTFL